MKTIGKTRNRKNSLFKEINNSGSKLKINREAFCGVIDFKIEPLAYQRKIRNEWR